MGVSAARNFPVNSHVEQLNVTTQQPSGGASYAALPVGQATTRTVD